MGIRSATQAFLFSLALSLASCEFQNINSMTKDEGSFAPSDGISPALKAARAVFQRSCVQCHSVFGSYKDAEWIASGLVSPGSPLNSTLYMRLRGAGLNGSQENMPPDTALDSSDRQLIYDWIYAL